MTSITINVQEAKDLKDGSIDIGLTNNEGSFLINNVPDIESAGITLAGFLAVHLPDARQIA